MIGIALWLAGVKIGAAFLGGAVRARAVGHGRLNVLLHAGSRSGLALVWLRCQGLVRHDTVPDLILTLTHLACSGTAVGSTTGMDPEFSMGFEIELLRTHWLAVGADTVIW